jgi:anti-anti-sigma factor
MSDKNDAVDRFPLSGPFTKETLDSLRAALSGVAAGELTLDLDGVPLLDTAAIANLITFLREARERGVTLRLAVTKPHLLETLRITGLDKVFTFATDSSPAEAAVERPRPRPSGRRLLAGMLAFCLLLPGLLGSRAFAQADVAPELTAAEIIAKVAEQNPSMQSYEARVSVNFRLKTFPYFWQHLDGTTYFKRPDNFEVVFDRVPSYAKGFEKLYSDIGDPTNWHKRFEIVRAGERVVGGHRDIVLRLTLIQRGQVSYEEVMVDPEKWHIDQMEWHYYNGGFISMSQDFKQQGEFMVLAAQHATIRIPHISASAEGVYGDYHTNVAIDDAVFTKAH